MGLLEWLVDPFRMRDPLGNILSEVAQGHSTCEPPTKPRIRLPEGKPYAQFQPTNFDEYIGQASAKRILASYIVGTKELGRPFPHILLSGSAGTGKSALIRILAKLLQQNCVETIASELETIDDIHMKLALARGGIVFIDEIHSLPRGFAESLYPIMQDFIHNGASIAPFTLAGATTELGELIKTRRPFVDRFKLQIELEPYTPEEIATIAQQYAEQTFRSRHLPPEVFPVVGENARATPRTAIRLVEAAIYLDGNIQQVLRNFNVLKNGYTKKDLQVLIYLERNGVVGVQGLSSFLNTAVENYLSGIEPFLIQTGVVCRTPRGRKITDHGRSIMAELQQTI